jgi:hypothetical protein
MKSRFRFSFVNQKKSSVLTYDGDFRKSSQIMKHSQNALAKLKKNKYFDSFLRIKYHRRKFKF